MGAKEGQFQTAGHDFLWLALKRPLAARFLPLLQLAMVPTQRRPLQVKYQVSCESLHRTVNRSALRSTHAESGTATSAHPTTSTAQQSQDPTSRRSLAILLISTVMANLQLSTHIVHHIVRKNQ